MDNWFISMVTSSWFPALWICAWVAGGSLCLMIRNRILLRPDRRPPYELFPVPPTCWFRLARCVDGRVQDVFMDRLQSNRFWKKAEKVFSTLLSETMEGIRSNSELLFVRLMIVLGEPEFYAIVPCRFPSVGGYATLSGPNRKKVILGLDPWLVSTPFARSAADHELVHCIQHLCHRIFTRQWQGRNPGRFFYEWQATWIGSRLILLTLAAVLFWPLLLHVPVLELGG